MPYDLLVQLVCDPGKDARNIQKHGVGLLAAAELFKWPVVTWIDTRRNYHETRRAALGLINGRVFMCIYVDRLDTRRIISLRKANKREQDAYYQSNPGPR